MLASATPVENISGSLNSERLFRITVASGATGLLGMTGGAVEMAISSRRVQRRQRRTRTMRAREFSDEPGQTCSVVNPQAGEWYILLIAAPGEHAGVTPHGDGHAALRGNAVESYLGFHCMRVKRMRLSTPRSGLRPARAVLAIAAMALLASCSDSPSGPPRSLPVDLQIAAQIGEGDPGRSVAIEAFYRRNSGEEFPLDIEPASIDAATGSIAAGTVIVDVLACVNDPQREPYSGTQTAGCRVYLVATLRAPNGTTVSETERVVPIARGARSAAVESFELPSGALVASARRVEMAATESGQLPAPVTVGITSSTALAGGALSASIQYVSGTGWLTATIPAGGNAVLIAPATATLAPGVYHATVRVTSSRMFEPVEIAVRYEVPHPPQTVTITGAGNGTGLVLATPSGASCTTTAGQLSGICAVPSPHGSVVELTPSAAVGSAFTGWAGACGGSGSCILTMSEARAVTATFTILKRELTIDAAGAGSGTITSSPAGISRTATAGVESGTCVGPFDHPTQVTLTAAANSATSTFSGWSGACTGPGACVVTMSEARAVTATFALIRRSLTLTMTGEGTGTVTSSPAGIECALAGQASKICTGTFDHGTVVSLTASPGAGMTFTGWAGACTGTGPCTVTMDAARAVTARIVPPTFPLTLLRAGNGVGYVEFINPERPSCSTSTNLCVLAINAGTVVLFRASLSNALGHVALSGCDRGDGTYYGQVGECQITVNGPDTVTVTFHTPSTKVVVNGSGTGVGIVHIGGAANVSCTITAGEGGCEWEMFGMLQSDLEVRATAKPGSVFGGLIGCPGIPAGVVSLHPSCTVRAWQHATVTAIFNLAPPPPTPSPQP